MKKTIIASGIVLDKGMWNSDFSGMSRRDSNNNIFATDKARKYSLRQELLLNGENVLIRRHEVDSNKVKSLINILKDEGLSLKKDKVNEELKSLYLKYIDLRIFGFILNPNGDFNFNSNGSFQVYYSNDINQNDTIDIISDITSYKPSGDTDANTTIGKHIVVDKGFMNYSIVVQPEIYKKEYRKIIGNDVLDKDIENQFNKDFKTFLEVIQQDVTNLNSCSKNGVDNLYNLVVTMKDSTHTIDLNNFKKIKVNELENKISIDFSNSIEVLKRSKNNIDSVILYIENDSNIEIGNIKDELENNGIKFEIKSLF